MYQFKKVVLCMVCIVFYGTNNAQPIPLTNISNITNILNESSGLTFITPNRLYTHNDSGGNDEIYELDTLGNLIRTITINSANNSDWEDITQDNQQNIYIGDFGNNNNDRTNLRVYKIPSPLSFSGNSTTANVIEFNYPDQTMFPPNPTKRNFDVEGFVWFNDSLFLFTKNRTAPFNGYCKMYKIPATPGTYTAQLCDSVFLCANSQNECWVTSAALSPDNSHLALLNNSKIWWFSCFNGSNFFEGKMATIALNSTTQKEGISFKNNHQVYITDEFFNPDNSGGNLYEANLINYLQMPYVNITPDTIICDNCTISVDVFAGSLAWNNGLFGPSITPTSTGWYSVVARTLNNCESIDSVYISYLQGLNENNLNKLSLVFNETSNSRISGIISNAKNEACSVYLTDISGKLISTLSWQSTQKKQSFTMPVNLSNGLYFLNLNSTQEHSAYKFIISN
jgi:hypothetical protein